jgi:hypothetical protein
MLDPHGLGPLSPTRARQLVLRVLESGHLRFSAHATQEMANDDLSTADCVNVLRGGVFEPPELERGTWRYRVSTRRMCFVISMASEDEVRVVTAWRKR